MMSWCRDAVVSFVQRSQGSVENAAPRVFSIVIDDEVDGDPRYLVLGGSDALIPEGVDNVRYSVLLVGGETVRSGFLAELLDSLSDRFNGVIVVS